MWVCPEERRRLRVWKAEVGENGSDGLGVLDLIGLPAKTGDLRVTDMVLKRRGFFDFEIVRVFRTSLDRRWGMALCCLPLPFFPRKENCSTVNYGD